MKFKKRYTVVLIGMMLSIMSATFANEVNLVSNKPIKITYRLVHQAGGKQAVFDKSQTIQFQKRVTIPINLKEDKLAGLVIVAVNDHRFDNLFAKSEQCSIATDKIKTKGTLKFTVSQHEMYCSRQGGVIE